MANHVYTNIEVRGINEDTKAFIYGWFDHIKGTFVGDAFHGTTTEGEDKGNECLGVQYLYEERTDDYDRQWMFDNVGSKWCNLEDVEIYDDTFTIRTMSAWSYPQEFVEYVVDTLQTQQEGLTVLVNYDDEMPNFYGCEVYVNGLCEDGFQDEEDEIEIGLCHYSEKYKELLEKYKESGEEDDELYDEMYDLRSDILYEMMDDRYQEVFRDYK